MTDKEQRYLEIIKQQKEDIQMLESKVAALLDALQRLEADYDDELTKAR